MSAAVKNLKYFIFERRKCRFFSFYAQFTVNCQHIFIKIVLQHRLFVAGLNLCIVSNPVWAGRQLDVLSQQLTDQILHPNNIEHSTLRIVHDMTRKIEFPHSLKC